MDDILAALKTRITSPLLGSFALAALATNWQAFFYLIVESGKVDERIAYFQQHTTAVSLLWGPLGFALTFSVVYPWVHYLLMLATSKPLELREVHQLQAEHKVLTKKKELEDARSKILASAERELIDRAKRDQELELIENEQLKQKLKEQLEELREIRNAAVHSPSVSTYDQHQQLMTMAAGYRAQATNARNPHDANTFLERARELETKAHSLVAGQSGA